MLFKHNTKEINWLKEYNVTNEMIANWLGYANTNSFEKSSAKNRIIEGLNAFAQYINQKDIADITRDK